MTETQKGRIVVADDDVENAKTVEEALKAEGYQVHVCHDGEAALHLVKSWMPHLAVLDINMPKMSGIETLKKIRAMVTQDYVGVILVTANSELEEIVSGLDAGADDYVVKPYRVSELRARVRTAMRIKALHDSLRRANKRLEESATLDELTGLRNMRFTMKRINEEVDAAKKKKTHLSCIMFDMDRFKLVNDMHDHLFGSHVLTEVAQVIKPHLRSGDVAARYGGDEFFVLLPGTPVREAVEVADRMRKALEAHLFKAGSHTTHVNASFGVAGTQETIDIDLLEGRELMRSADSALYDAKNSGRNRVETYKSFKKE